MKITVVTLDPEGYPEEKIEDTKALVQAIEVGGIFYINWYQGFHSELYAKAMRDIMKEAGMNSVAMERVE